ncbi:hypothetical protein BU16DRAFT_516550 [Lophium mytilinum]|uniref:Uncharacterized protein n=1 Tax=Lophium mytilinum TaxID=390894 RepID=A0A6A6QE99_9PEZI|nr:hypothetical protein BU16DRAFT_516550 [Lophium mytilinum]
MSCRRNFRGDYEKNDTNWSHKQPSSWPRKLRSCGSANVSAQLNLIPRRVQQALNFHRCMSLRALALSHTLLSRFSKVFQSSYSHSRLNI